MRIIAATCFLVIFVCAGCGTSSYWYNKDNTYQHARSDCLDCMYQVQREILESTMQDDDNYEDSADVYGTYEQTLFEKCMKERGYDQVSENELDYRIRKGIVNHKEEVHQIAGK